MQRISVYSIILLMLFLTGIPGLCAESVGNGRIVVTHDGFSEQYAGQILAHAEKSLDEVSGAFGIVPRHTVEIILADTDERFNELTRGRLPEWSAAAALGNGRIVISPLKGNTHFVNRIITHEIVHIMIDDASGGQFVPRWFHEGCAQYFSGEWRIRDRFYLTWHTVFGNLMRFQDIQDVFTSGLAGAGLAYDQSMLAIRHLTGLHGRQVLSAIMNGLARGFDFPTAFYSATGTWPSEFEEQYLAAIHKTYGKRSLYLLVPGTWTLIMMLAVIAWFVKRRRNRRLMNQWEIVEAAEKIINFEDYRRNHP